MLEAQLLVKLSEAKTLWVTPPYYRNDAQDVIRSAVSAAADTKWEEPIAAILDNEMGDYDSRLESFLHNNHLTKDDVATPDAKAYSDWERECSEADARWEQWVIGGIDSTISSLCDEIGDKIHRRNLQIADLKRENDQRVNQAHRDMDREVGRLSQEVERLGQDANREHRNLDKANIAIGNANMAILAILSAIDSAAGLDRSTETIKNNLYAIANALKY